MIPLPVSVSTSRMVYGSKRSAVGVIIMNGKWDSTDVRSGEEPDRVN